MVRFGNAEVEGESGLKLGKYEVRTGLKKRKTEGLREVKGGCQIK